jgi:membrane protease YdiL (CAAX protease family)
MVYPDPRYTPPSAIGSPEDSTTDGQKRLIAVAEVLLCSSLPTQIVIGQLLAAMGLDPRTDGGQLSPPFAFALLLIDSVVLTALMVVLTRAHGESPRALWLGDRPVFREIGVGLALVPIVFLTVALLLAALMRLLPGLHNVAENPIEQLAAGGPGQAAMLGFIAVVAGGVREELQRAFLLRRFELHLGGPMVGVGVLSILFGLGHFPQGWDAVIATGALGAIWAIVYLRRRSSIAPIVSHAGFNSLEVLRVALSGLR